MAAFALIKLSRRAFAKFGLALGLRLAVGVASQPGLASQPDIASQPGMAYPPGSAEALTRYRPKTLTQHELATVEAVMSRLIPADGKNGGAVEACAFVYLDYALGTYQSHYLALYRSGLAELDRLARQAGSAGFTALTPSNMDALLARMEKGELTKGAFSDGGLSFFNLFRRHTLEGFLCDPMYGGNKDFIGWRAIGYHGVQLDYPEAAQQLNGRDDRQQHSIAEFGGRPLL